MTSSKNQRQLLHVTTTLLKQYDLVLTIYFLLEMIMMTLIIFLESLNAISLLSFHQLIFILKLFFPFLLILQLVLMHLEYYLSIGFLSIFGLNQQVPLKASRILAYVEVQMLVVKIRLELVNVAILIPGNWGKSQKVEQNLEGLGLMERLCLRKGFFYHLFSSDLFKAIALDFMLVLNHRYFPF